VKCLQKNGETSGCESTDTGNLDSSSVGDLDGSGWGGTWCDWGVGWDISRAKSNWGGWCHRRDTDDWDRSSTWCSNWVGLSSVGDDGGGWAISGEGGESLGGILGGWCWHRCDMGAWAVSDGQGSCLSDSECL